MRGVGKALTKSGKSLTKAGSKKSIKQAEKFRRRRQIKRKRRGRSERNDPGFTVPLTLTGAAGVGVLAKQLMEDRKKNRTGGR